jgi:hypothetical protein
VVGGALGEGLVDPCFGALAGIDVLLGLTMRH